MKLFRWVKGRQSGTDYKAWCFFYFTSFNIIGLDAYILKYEAHTVLPLHKDPVDGKHYRLNIKIKGRTSFRCPSVIFRFKERIILFRPDLFYHSLTAFTKTYKLSFGLCIFRK